MILPKHCPNFVSLKSLNQDLRNVFYTFPNCHFRTELLRPISVWICKKKYNYICTFKLFNRSLGGIVLDYRISTNSFRKNYPFLKVENVEIFIQFSPYGNFLLHKLNSCRGNYSRGKLFKEGNYSRKYGKLQKVS